MQGQFTFTWLFITAEGTAYINITDLGFEAEVILD
jgi:hypothetical protein